MTKSGIGQFARAVAWPLSIASTSALTVAFAYEGDWIFATAWALLTLAYVAAVTGERWVHSVRMETLGLVVVRKSIALRDADTPLADLTRHPFEAQARELLAKAYEERGYSDLGRSIITADKSDSAAIAEITAMCAAYDAGVAKGGASMTALPRAVTPPDFERAKP